ncbi:hypothetical protein NNU90_002305 [Citrobacter farmeri]|nr:hypothetical protein [Citrobacter farmeri]
MVLNKTKGLWLIAFLLTGLALVLLYQRQWPEKNFKCDGEITITQHNALFNGLLRFTFEGGEGRYDAKGIYQMVNEPAQTEVLSVQFRYWLEDGSIIMVSALNNATSLKSAQSLNLPDFFLKPGRGFVLKMQPLNSDTVILLENDLPVLVCHRTR